MKKSLKKLAILFLVFAITVVALPVVKLAPKAVDTDTTTGSISAADYFTVLRDGTTNDNTANVQLTTASPDGNCFESSGNPRFYYLNFPATTKAIVIWVKLKSDQDSFFLRPQASQTADNENYSNIFSGNKDFYFLSTDPAATTNTVYSSTNDEWFNKTPALLGDSREGYFIIPVESLTETVQEYITSKTQFSIRFDNNASMNHYYDQIGYITDMNAFFKDTGIIEKNSAANSKNWKLGPMSATTGFNAPFIVNNHNSISLSYASQEGASLYNVNVYNSDHFLVDTYSTDSTSIDIIPKEGEKYFYQVVAENAKGKSISASAMVSHNYYRPYYTVLANGSGVSTGGLAATTATPDGSGYNATSNTFYFYGLDFPENTEALIFYLDVGSKNKIHFYNTPGIGISESGKSNYSVTGNTGTWYWHLLNTDVTGTTSAKTFAKLGDVQNISTTDLNNIYKSYFVLPITAYSAEIQELIKTKVIDFKIHKAGSWISPIFDRIGAITDLDDFYADTGISSISTAANTVTNSKAWRASPVYPTAGFAAPIVTESESNSNIDISITVPEGDTAPAKYIVNTYDETNHLTFSYTTTETSCSLPLNCVKEFQVLALDESDNIIAASALAELNRHSVSEAVDYLAPTCTEAGHNAHYICYCNSKFSDSECTTEISDSDIHLNALDHDMSTGDYKAENSDNEKHYHVCSRCGIKDEGEAHIPSNPDADAFTTNVCTVCSYVIKPAGTYIVDFEGDATLNGEYLKKHTKTNVTTNGTKADGVFTIKSSKNEGASAASGNIGELYTVDSDVIAKFAQQGRFLSSGSFDMKIPTSAHSSNVVVFGYDNDESTESTNEGNFTFFSIGNTNLNALAPYYLTSSLEKDTAFNAHTSGGTGNNTFNNYYGLPHAAIAGQWMHFEFMYTNDSKLILVATDKNGQCWHWSMEFTYDAANRILAFGEAWYDDTTPDGNVIDNVVLNFTDNGSVNEGPITFYTNGNVRDVSELEPKKIVPHDFEKINYALNLYIKYKDNVSLKFNYSLNKLMSDLSAQMEAWGNTAAESTYAQNYYKLYFGIDTPDYLSAYNVYTRLTKKVKALFRKAYPDSYSAMINEVKESKASDSFNIITVSDNIFSSEGGPAFYTYLNNALPDSYYKATTDNIAFAIGSNFRYSATSSHIQLRHSSGLNLQRFNNTLYGNDAVLLNFGSTDIINNWDVTNEANRKALKDAYTDLVHLYLSHGNPTVILSTLPVYVPTSSSGYYGTVKERYDKYVAIYNQVIREVADEYGIQLADFAAYSESFTYADFYNNNNIYRNSLLSATGKTKLASYFADYLKSGLNISNNASATICDFESSATYSPKLLGGTIDATAESAEGKQNLYFNYQLPTDIPTEADTEDATKVYIKEHGIIVTYDQYILKNFDIVTEKQDLSVLNASGGYVKNDYVIKIPNEAGLQLDNNDTYSVAVAMPQQYHGVRVIARAYVILSDGRAYYSYNTDSDELNQNPASEGLVGVVDGYAIRSISGIAMSISRYLALQGSEKYSTLTDDDEKTLTDFIDIDNLGSVTGWSDSYKDAAKASNGKEFIVFLAKNRMNINQILLGFDPGGSDEWTEGEEDTDKYENADWIL